MTVRLEPVGRDPTIQTTSRTGPPTLPPRPLLTVWVPPVFVGRDSPLLPFRRHRSEWYRGSTVHPYLQTPLSVQPKTGVLSVHVIHLQVSQSPTQLLLALILILYLCP